MTTALHRLSATTLSAMVRRGEVSVLELTDAFLARIARRNEALQAFVHVAGFRARRTARRLDDARRRGALPTSPLSGLPLGIKDLYPVRLMPVRAGSRSLGPMIAPVDGPNVRRLREAGVVILGKLATSEFGAMPFTEPDIHPPTRNPWDLTTTAGGSSGGTAAAVAAGLVPLGHGSDGGGSIRIPAAMCGLFGFKPSRGALHHASPTEKLRLATEGPLAHSVDDAVALLQVLATDDRFTGPVPPPRGLRVRVVVESSEPALAPVDARMVAATQRVAAALSSLSHHVDGLGPLPLTVDEFLPLWQRTLAWAPTVPPFGDRLQPITRWLREAGRRIAEDDARARLARVIATVDAWWGDADVVVCPTVSCLPPKVGSWKHDDPARAFASAIPMAIFTAGFNASGQPAMNIPVRVDGVAGPVGVQVIARRGDDARLIALARQLEEALGGFDHRPPTEP
jgi:amidase